MVEVLVVLAGVDDLREELGIVEETGVVEQGDPDDLRPAVTDLARAVRDPGVIVLHVELPRDPGRLETVEDRGNGKPSSGSSSWRGWPGVPETQYMWFVMLPANEDVKKRSKRT